MLRDLASFGIWVFVFWMIVAGVPAILCGPLARGKGRDVAVWVMLGFLGGWMTFLFLAVLPVVNNPRRRRPLHARRLHR
jgi:hypothetical protein